LTKERAQIVQRFKRNRKEDIFQYEVFTENGITIFVKAFLMIESIMYMQNISKTIDFTYLV